MFSAFLPAAWPAGGGRASVLRIRATRPAAARAPAGLRAQASSSWATAMGRRRSRPRASSMASALAEGRAAPAGLGTPSPRSATARVGVSDPQADAWRALAPGRAIGLGGAPGVAGAFPVPARDHSRPAEALGVSQAPRRPGILGRRPCFGAPSKRDPGGHVSRTGPVRPRAPVNRDDGASAPRGLPRRWRPLTGPTGPLSRSRRR